MLRWILVPTTVLALWPTTALAQPETGAKKPPGPAKAKPETSKGAVLKTVRTTPVGGFTLGNRRFGVQLEFGYPFFNFQVGYGLGTRFQVFVGYRGIYTVTHTPYGGIKVALFANPRKTVGLSFTALGGWTHVRDSDSSNAATESFAGGSGGFGEAMLSITARKGRHGVLINAGARIAQVAACSDCENHLLDGDSGVIATAFAEVGYEYRFMQHMSYFVAAGADFFTNSEWTPAMPRFRTGVVVDF